MTREEEIKCASKDYVNCLLDKQEYHNENYTEYDIKQAFEKGAMFVNNLCISSLLHSADEEPPKDTYILIEISFEDRLEYYSCDWSASVFLSWEEYVKAYHVKRWMYISDLFPKDK